MLFIDGELPPLSAEGEDTPMGNTTDASGFSNSTLARLATFALTGNSIASPSFSLIQRQAPAPNTGTLVPISSVELYKSVVKSFLAFILPSADGVSRLQDLHG